MNQKKLGIIVASVVAIVVVVITALFVFNPKPDTPNTIPKSGEKSSSTANPSEKEKNEKSDIEKSKEGSTTTKTIEELQKEIPKIDEKKSLPGGSVEKSIPGYSVGEIEAALNFSAEYANVALGNTYFLGGEWIEKGHKIKDVQTLMSPYFSQSVIKELDKADSLAPKEFANKVMPLVAYFGDNGDVRPSEYCKTVDPSSTEIKNPCPTDFSISTMNYNSVEDKGTYYLDVSFKAGMSLPVTIKDGDKDGVTKVSYEYDLRLDRNIDGSGETSYEIVGYKITPSFSNVSEVN